jgi:hypothetical protein
MDGIVVISVNHSDLVLFNLYRQEMYLTRKGKKELNKSMSLWATFTKTFPVYKNTA